MAKRGFNLELNSGPESAGVLEVHLLQFMTDIGLPERTKIDVLISCDEAFANIHHSSYKGHSDGIIRVEVQKRKNLISITFTDYTNKPVLLNCKPVPGKPILKEQGPHVGIYLMKELMDNIEYSRLGMMNRLVLKKIIADTRPRIER